MGAPCGPWARGPLDPGVWPPRTTTLRWIPRGHGASCSAPLGTALRGARVLAASYRWPPAGSMGAPQGSPLAQLYGPAPHMPTRALSHPLTLASAHRHTHSHAHTRSRRCPHARSCPWFLLFPARGPHVAVPDRRSGPLYRIQAEPRRHPHRFSTPHFQPGVLLGGFRPLPPSLPQALHMLPCVHQSDFDPRMAPSSGEESHDAGRIPARRALSIPPLSQPSTPSLDN